MIYNNNISCLNCIIFCEEYKRIRDENISSEEKSRRYIEMGNNCNMINIPKEVD